MYQSRNRLVQAHNARIQEQRMQPQLEKQAKTEKTKHIVIGAIAGAAAVLLAPEAMDVAVDALLRMEQDLIHENNTHTFDGR